MNHLIKTLFLLLLIFISQNFGAYVAILETTANKVNVSRNEKQYLTDVLRQKAVKILPANQGYTIMTRENIISMLPPGKSIEECEGECLTETGKNISADYIAQGRLGTFGSKITLTIEMYETAGNKLVSSFTTRKTSIEEIAEEIELKTDSLFLSIKAESFIIQPNLPGITTDFKENNSETDDFKNEFQDHRDGKTYKIKVVKNKAVMASNLNYKIAGSYCYNDKDFYCNTYGRLYTWHAARAACPEGWNLPTITELKELANTLWENKPIWGGLRTFAGIYEDLNKNAYYWSSSPHDKKKDYAYYLDYRNDMTQEKAFYKDQSYSVRCVRALSSKEFASVEQRRNVVKYSNDIPQNYMKDFRDQQLYKTVVIGDKTYMAENLNYKTLSSFCYDDDFAKCKQTGRLYTWASAIQACPTGWRLPTIDEITRDFPKFSRNTFQNGGFRMLNGNYSSFGKKNAYWSSDFKKNYTDYAYYGLQDGSDWETKAFYKDQANSVRCVKED